MDKVRVRFAPSPTGFLHIGGLRTALYNYLFAKHNNGDFILRIEDTDRTRYVEGAIENLIQSLKWAGIEVDEGVILNEEGKLTEKGQCGPYIQSNRLDIYKKYVDKLIESGHAYYCFCSKERLDNLREEQRIKGQVPKYDGRCRSIPIEEAKRRIANGEEYVVRLKLPRNRFIKFHDLVRGDVTINTDEIDDQVLMKSDGFPTYHMAVVVDDHLMKITHVVRGEEWLASTPKHVFLYEALGWEAPEFVHLPTVLNKNHKKLSKREGDVSVEDFKKRGYLPEGLINYLALVGWSPEDDEEIMTLKDLIPKFSFDRVVKSGGIFDVDKLNWVNSHYMKDYDLEKLCQLEKPYMIESGLMTEEEIDNNFEWFKILVETVRDGLDKLEDLPKAVQFLFGDLNVKEESALEELKKDHVLQLIDQFIEELNSLEEVDDEFSRTVMKKIQKATGIKGKDLYMPVRAAISGNVHGPELNNIILLLGKENLLKRLNSSKKYLK
ncbi:nondiscriminating glutamyl-tRNA synthetase [Peptoniphilus koenoeneniae]|uniref:Glutamate--tRNA ligase n=1 Tax=Peptoniphilus koenoeneniae TaxID=507751 RepID=A0ABU0AVZ2_9FIRM|nr:MULTISPECIES: glutamate--tRNA ligase [Peptoniphilus]ERT57980.1 glutamate--tRNA ligase [Peptoniphilus sp. BV3C26]MDQ0275393.1 nondiscriminating glutamyl-tRNA synthetase [Peptoniphilus koenoeneniae]